jgi:hypothetical protein
MDKPFIEIGPDHFYIIAYDIKPLKGYEKPVDKETKKELPYCCGFHEGVLENITDHYDRFPNCCKWHKPLNNAEWFKKDDYSYVVDKVVNQVSYTEHCINKHINDIDWYDAIVDYIDLNISSFGQFLKGYGGPVGLSVYTFQVKHYITNTDLKIPKHKRVALLKSLEIEDVGLKPKSDKTDLNVLYATYQKWLKIFPFELSLFKHLKEHFKIQLPLINGKPKVNRYTGISSVKLHTKDSLIETLINLTNSILTQINTVSLYEKGLLTEPNKIQLELVLNERKNKLASGYINESKNEDQRFRNILKEWYKDEVQFIDKLTPLLPKHTEQLSTKTTKLIGQLDEYKFSEYLKEKGYKPFDIFQMIQNHSGKELMPYTIALLSEIKYLEYFFDEFSKNKAEGYKKLSKIFESQERRIKGNINVLNENSKENPTQYTSHTFIEKIRKSL